MSFADMDAAIPIFKNGYEVSVIHPPPPAVFSSLLKKLKPPPPSK
jgi:hypothetical protein